MPSQSEEEFIYRLQSVPIGDVEAFCAQVWEAYGWEPKRLHADEPAAIDLTVTQAEPVKIIGALYLARTGGTTDVAPDRVFDCLEMRQVADRMDFHVLITDGEFSRDAWALGREQNIKMITGEDLYELADNVGILELLT